MSRLRFSANPTQSVSTMRTVAWEVQDRFGLSFWDGLIVAAAQASGCRHLLTEDLQDGQDLGGVIVVDPFRHEPREPS